MKKIIYSLICLLISVNYVYADTFTASLDGDDTFDDKLTLNLKIDSLTGFSNGLYGIDTTLEYDKNKIALDSITSSNFDVTYDISKSDKIVAYSNIGVLTNSRILTFIFKNIALNDDEEITINLVNSIASDGENDINGTITGKTVTYHEPDYMKGDFNKDGEIGLVDVIYILKIYLGVENIKDGDIQIGDMNNDGEINLTDVITLLRIYLGVN